MPSPDVVACYQLWRHSRFNKVFILAAIFNYVSDKNSDFQLQFHFVAWQLSFFPFGPASVTECWWSLLHFSSSTRVLRLDLSCQASADKSLQQPPLFSLCCSSEMSTREQERCALIRNTHTLLPCFYATEGPERTPSNIFLHFFFSLLLVINSVSLIPVSPGARWHLCSGGTSTCSPWALWIKPAWKSCISHITEHCSGGFARQRRALKINVALQGIP